MTDLPTSPAELSILLRRIADWLDELHARREGTWLPGGPPNPFDDLETSYGSGAEAWATPAGQEFLRTMRGGLEPGPAEKRIDALLESLGGPLPEQPVDPQDMAEIFADDTPPTAETVAATLAADPTDDLTATQAQVLAFLRERPRGFMVDDLARTIPLISGARPTDSVLQLFRGALGVLVERGLAKKVETKLGGLILAKDAPEPDQDVPISNAAAHAPELVRPRRVPYDPRGSITDAQSIASVLYDLMAHPRSTAGQIAARLRIPVKNALAELVRSGQVEGEGRTRGRRYSFKEGGGT